MAYEMPRILSVLGNTIHVEHPAIPDGPLTYLTDSVSATGTTLTVADNGGFANADLILIGKYGLDKSEIKAIGAAVSAGTSITVAAVSYDHPVDVEVRKVLWDQIEISGASTATGSKTVIATVSITPDRKDTSYINTGTTYSFYFVRFKESAGSTYSEYSDAAAAGGYDLDTVRQVKDDALSMINENVCDRFPDSWLNQQILNCDREVWGERQWWSWAYTFNHILGDTTQGGYRISLPSDISDANSNKSILQVWVKDRPKLRYLTKQKWQERYQGVVHTALAGDVALVDTTIDVDDASDLEDDGSIMIGSDEIDYTGITSNQLTGVTNISSTHSTDDDVWQGATYREPTAFTVDGGYIYFDSPVNSTYASKNVYIDYYREPTAIDSDSDTVNIPDVSIYHYYLAWKILLKKSGGNRTDDSESMRRLYEARKKILRAKERTGQRIKITPQTNSFDYSSERQIFEDSNAQA